MRILYCNKFNYPFGGTEVYLFELMDLMRAHGHEVALFSMADARGEPTKYDHHFVPAINFKTPASWTQKIGKAAHAIYSVESRRRIRAMIRDFQPDIAHVRGIYHHLSPSILWELRAQNVPVVFHINDFKPLCPNYNLLANGVACEACKGGSFWRMLQSRCYPGLGARLTLTSEAYVHRWIGSYRKCIDLLPPAALRETSLWNMAGTVVNSTSCRIFKKQTRCRIRMPLKPGRYCMWEDFRRKKASTTCYGPCSTSRNCHCS